MATLKSATLKLWIYDGIIGNYDVNNPNYVISKEKLNSQETILFEIGELVKDYIKVEFDGDYGLANLTAWVSYEVTNTFTDLTQTKQTGVLLGTQGYGYFEDLINPQLIEPLQQSNTCIYWKKGEKVRVPLYAGQSMYDAEWFENGVSVKKTPYGENLTPITADTTLYSADNVSNITADTTHITNVEESSYSVSEYSPVGADKVVITTRDNKQVTVHITYIEECKNDQFKVTFLNKFGVLQDVWMFGRRKERADVTRESYKVNTIHSSTAKGTFYPTWVDTDKTYNVNTKKSLTLNTGFVCEQYSEVMQQLILSERIWIHEDNKVFPVTAKDSGVEYKTELYEKLINYTISVEYAYSEINLVR